MTRVHDQLALQTLAFIDRTHQSIKGFSQLSQLVDAPFVHAPSEVSSRRNLVNFSINRCQGTEDRGGGEVAETRRENQSEQCEEKERDRENLELMALTRDVRHKDLGDRKSTRLNSSHSQQSRMPSSA